MALSHVIFLLLIVE